MSDPIKMPKLEGFGCDAWHFFNSDVGKEGGGIRTCLEDNHVIGGCVEFWTEKTCLSASVLREDDRWLWEAGSTPHADRGYVSTLPAAVAAAEASMKRMFQY